MTPMDIANFNLGNIPRGVSPSDSNFIPNAKVATRYEGVIWQGNIHLRYDAKKLEAIAEELQQNVYIFPENSDVAVGMASAQKRLF